MTSYAASNIKVLSQDEAQIQFQWLRVHELAHEYSRPVEFIERLFESCRLAGVDSEWGIDRYLKKLPDTPRNLDVEAISMDLQTKAHRVR